MKVGSDREAASRPSRPSRGVDEIGVYYILFCAGGPSKIGPVMGEYTPINSPITGWDFLWKSYSLSQSKQIWTTNRSVYIMFFMDFVVFAAQILAFAICFSWILRVGAVQANTFCANVWNSHEKTNNLKFKKAGFSAKSQRFPRFCTPSPQIWAENRRFAALAKRNHQKAKIGLLMIIIENGIYSKWPSRVKLPPSCPGSMVLPGPVSAVCALMSFCPSCMQGLTCPLPSPVLHLTKIFFCFFFRTRSSSPSSSGCHG